jgi:hypothetical protein
MSNFIKIHLDKFDGPTCVRADAQMVSPNYEFVPCILREENGGSSKKEGL